MNDRYQAVHWAARATMHIVAACPPVLLWQLHNSRWLTARSASLLFLLLCLLYANRMVIAYCRAKNHGG